MNNPKYIHPKVPNIAFFENRSQRHSSRSQGSSLCYISELTPNKSNIEKSLEISFGKLKNEAKISQDTNSPTENLEYFSHTPQKFIKQIPLANYKTILSESDILKTDFPMTPLTFAKRFDNIVKNIIHDESSEQLNEKMKDKPSAEINVSDIRRRMRSYHPISSVENPTKYEEMSFMQLSRQAMQELKKNKKTEKLALQLKRIKQQNIDKMFQKIREESDKNIKDSIQKLRVITKQDAQFHEKFIQGLEELTFLKKDLILGFENICLKGTLNPNNYVCRDLTKNIMKDCGSCNSNGESKEIYTDKIRETSEHNQIKSPLSARLSSYRETRTTEETQRKTKVSEYRIRTLEKVPQPFQEEEKSPKLGLFRSISVRRVRSIDQDYLADGITKKTSHSDRKKPKNSYQLRDPIGYIMNENDLLQRGLNCDFQNHDRGKSLSHYFPNDPFPPRSHKISEKKKIELAKIEESSQLIPRIFHVKLSKPSIIPSDNFLLKFILPNSTFEIELKLNEASGIDLSQKLQQNEKINSTNKIILQRFKTTSKGMNEIASEIESETQSPQTKNRDQNGALEFEDSCQECLHKLEGLKQGLKYFQDIDEKAINLEAENMEILLSKLEKVSNNKNQYDDLELRNSLKEACKNIEIFFKSCFNIAPIHIMKLEKLFKITLFFFEAKIRKYIVTQNLLLTEIEEGKVFLKHKKKLFEKLQKLEEDNKNLVDELKISQQKAKEDKHKNKEHIRLLMIKIEELRGSSNFQKN